MPLLGPVFFPADEVEQTPTASSEMRSVIYIVEQTPTASSEMRSVISDISVLSFLAMPQFRS